MSHSDWLRNWFEVNRSRKDRRQLVTQSRKQVRLILEALEERLVPSAPTQTAGSYTDLVNAVAADTAANTNYDIQITNNFTFNSGEQVFISGLGTGSTLTVEGQNNTNYTLTGNGNHLFNIGPGQNVTLADLTLTRGAGAIADSGGNVTLSKVAIQNNSVKGIMAEGGGVYVAGGGSLTIQGGSVFQSNEAVGTGIIRTGDGGWEPGSGAGGALYVNGPSNVTIRDSTFSKNIAQGGHGANANSRTVAFSGGGGSAKGGGIYVGGSGWTVTLMGDTLSGNSVVGGNGGNGEAGGNATPSNAFGSDGSHGSYGGEADGGAAYFSLSSSSGSASLTILNDATNPSIFIGNSAQGGSGGNGGAGGASTGTASNSNGGYAGVGNGGVGGAVDIFISYAANALDAQIGNSSFYGNSAAGGNGGQGGAAGTGGLGPAGNAGGNGTGGGGGGGGLALGGGNVTVVNSTVAKNSVRGGLSGGAGAGPGGEAGAGIYDTDGDSVILANNTITQNTDGDGVDVDDGNPIIVNNLMTGNYTIAGTEWDLGSNSGTSPMSALNYNFITAGYSSSTDIHGNTQPQLGSVVGVDANGNLTGGPIYYPLLPNVVSIGYGTTAILDKIASVEGTTTANATDQTGNPRTNNGSIDLGAVQYQGVLVPIVTANPTSQSVTAGGNVTFTASARGNPPPSIQWQVSSDGGKTFTDISGATSTTLTLNNVTAAMNGYEYQTVFTNSAGSVTSSAATLTVTSTVAPVITGNPSSQAVTVGQSAAFTASASGTPTPTVQWQVSRDGGKTFSNIGGATSTTLALNDVTAAMNGYQYQAVFTNSAGSATTSAATLTVTVATVAPVITSNPSSQTVTAGQSATFSASAGGSPTPTVQWQVSSDGGKTFTDITGATSTTLMLNGVTTAMSGYEYEAAFTNSAGTATTSAATLTVNPSVAAPSITGNPRNQIVTVGQTVTFTAAAKGNPTPTVQWRVSTDGGQTFTNINGATSTTLALRNVTTAMNGYEYEAIFTNSVGHGASSPATLAVNSSSPPPPPPLPPSPPAPPVLNVPPLLSMLDSLLGATEIVNGNGTETITDSFFGIPLIVSTFDSHGDLMSIDLFGFFNITFLFA